MLVVFLERISTLFLLKCERACVRILRMPAFRFRWYPRIRFRPGLSSQTCVGSQKARPDARLSIVYFGPQSTIDHIASCVLTKSAQSLLLLQVLQAQGENFAHRCNLNHFVFMKIVFLLTIKLIYMFLKFIRLNFRVLIQLLSLCNKKIYWPQDALSWQQLPNWMN